MKREGVKSWGAFLLLGLVILLLAACSPTSRYELLSFLFDGVPPPPGTVVETAQPMAVEPLSPFRRAVRSLPKPELEAQPPPIVSVHQPVAERKCQQCHDPQSGFSSMPRDETLCDKCHREERIEGGWDHGPINLGTCIPCHVAHESIYPHLLEKPVPEVCLHCHTTALDRVPDYHDVENIADCIACHDPHRMY